MMKYLLVEDERFAYEEMKRMMEKLRPDYQLEAWTATVEQTSIYENASGRYFSRNRSRRLLFLLLPMMSMPYRHSR